MPEVMDFETELLARIDKKEAEERREETKEEEVVLDPVKLEMSGRDQIVRFLRTAVKDEALPQGAAFSFWVNDWPWGVVKIASGKATPVAGSHPDLVQACRVIEYYPGMV